MGLIDSGSSFSKQPSIDSDSCRNLQNPSSGSGGRYRDVKKTIFASGRDVGVEPKILVGGKTWKTLLKWMILGVPLFLETPIYVAAMRRNCIRLHVLEMVCHTVDGSEIRRSPVEVGSFFPIIYRVLKHPNGGFLARFLFSINRWCPGKKIWGVLEETVTAYRYPFSNLSKKSPTGPTERTPKPGYLRTLATYLAIRWDSVPFNF